MLVSLQFIALLPPHLTLYMVGTHSIRPIEALGHVIISNS
jgi:hypothetical protein